MWCLSLHELGHTSLVGANPAAFKGKNTKSSRLWSVLHNIWDSILKHVNFSILITLLVCVNRLPNLRGFKNKDFTSASLRSDQPTQITVVLLHAGFSGTQERSREALVSNKWLLRWLWSFSSHQSEGERAWRSVSGRF